MKEKFKSIFVSDIHLGTKGCQFNNFLNLIESLNSDNLFILGDFIDGWKIKKSHYWNTQHTNIIRKLLKKTKKETNIYYIIGNHDEFLGNFIGILDRINILNEYIYETNEKKILLCHGHQFDYVIKHIKIIGIIGSIGYNILISFNHKLNQIRSFFHLKPWSISKFIKENVKNIIVFLTNYEECILKYLKNKKFDGIIFGHLHHPIIDKKNDLFYFNCGDFVENSTAILEDYDGNFYLVSYLNCDKKIIIKQINIRN